MLHYLRAKPYKVAFPPVGCVKVLMCVVGFSVRSNFKLTSTSRYLECPRRKELHIHFGLRICFVNLHPQIKGVIVISHRSKYLLTNATSPEHSIIKKGVHTTSTHTRSSPSPLRRNTNPH